MEYFSSLKPKLIYIFRINDEAHRDCVKIGEATFDSDNIFGLSPNCSVLNKAARARIDRYTKTAGIAYELKHTEIAITARKDEHGEFRFSGFNDKEVHDVLLRSGIRRKEFPGVSGSSEWFVCPLTTAIQAIAAVKEGRKSLNASDKGSDEFSPIIFRPEQTDAIEKTLKQFKKGTQMLWNAKMRFGKTLSALQVVKCRNADSEFASLPPFRRVLILTHRPVVDSGWYEDFQKIFYDTPTALYGSKTNGETLANMERLARKDTHNYVYFASMQDLRGSELVGGNFDKNNDIFSTHWDLIIVDEAHEGTQTELGRAVMAELTKKDTKVLNLSGTPFNLLENYNESEIYTWDYVMEQRAKAQWDIDHPGDHNPYAGLPRLNIYTYDLGRLMGDYADEDIAFNFREFFRTKEDGSFVHEKHVENFLNLLTKTDEESMYPFANNRYRDIFRHTLWMVPGVKSAKALAKMLRSHPVFGMFEVVNVAGDGDEEEANEEALRKVEKAIGKDPDKTRTITLSCGRLTTGVSVKPWTGVFMLSGSFNTAASAYMQTIFRVQTPATINGRVKEDCYVFDFAPDRTLRVLAETAKISTKAGEHGESERRQLGEFLNFCPIIAIEGSQMKQLDTEHMLQQLKRVYVERVVQNGFEDGYLYNNELMKLNNIDIRKFNKLKAIIGQTKAMAKTNDITVNDQGLTNEEYEEKKKLEKKKKRELTEDEKARLEELKEKKKGRETAISILRGISIRMPLLIYGAKINNEDTELTIENFTELVDDLSWEEFMPPKVTKELFKEFTEYYDPDIFTAAAKRIRQMARAADTVTIEERIERIASIFATFRNPDKETVLTPWRVVNMHMSDCLGGYTFFNGDFSVTIEEPRFVDRGAVTADVFSPESRLLEINSKSGLYPLYLAYNIYRSRLRNAMSSPVIGLPLAEQENLEEHQAMWDAAVAENIFVICKTPMAKAITRRTLLGFRKGKTNMWAPDDLINKIKNQPELFIKKVKDLIGKNVKINAIVGNPPYQEMDGGAGVSAGPVYNLFVDVPKKTKPTYLSMIMPARWFAGGKGLDDFRENMLHDKSIKLMVDYFDSTEVFPTVDLSGGVCYWLRDAEYNGLCSVTSHRNGATTTANRFLLTNGDSFVRFNEAVSIVQKVNTNPELNFSSLVSVRKPFGIATNERINGAKESADDVDVFAYPKNGFLPLDRIHSNNSAINQYKVFISYAYGERGNFPYFAIGKPFIGSPNSICSETYLIVNPTDNLTVAENTSKYMRSKFLRFMVLLKKNTQHATSKVYSLVPLQDFTDGSDIDWSKSVAEIDAQLYAKYGLTDEEIAFIESMIKPM